MEKLFVPSEEKRMEVFSKKITSSLHFNFISTSKKVWQNTISEVSVFLFNFHKKQQLKYKKIVETHGDKNTLLSSEKSTKTVAVSEEIVIEILAKLKQFETDKRYLNKDIDLSSLAKSLGTNHSYLSRVVNQVKEKSFKNYINDLRIEYAYIDLQINPTKRRYTIEAIAQEMGFKSAESFSKKFKDRFNMYPSTFLRKLNEGG